MATHSRTLAWKIPWTEEPGRLQSMGSQRVGHDWATSLSDVNRRPRSSREAGDRCGKHSAGHRRAPCDHIAAWMSECCIFSFQSPITNQVTSRLLLPLLPSLIQREEGKMLIGTSLIAQWLGIHLPVQGTQVQCLVWKDPTCCGATQPMSHSFWAPVHLEPTSHDKRSHSNKEPKRHSEEEPRPLQLEKTHTATKTHHSQNHPINKIIKKNT